MAEDMIYGIMSRLPLKSLARFRCVCKLWLKYINDPYLHTIHVKEEPTPIVFEHFPDKIRISLLRGVVLTKDPVLELSYWGQHPLLASWNGLSLVCYEQDPCDAGTYRFALINPLSKKRHDLPTLSIVIADDATELDGPCDAAGIGFDDSTNSLKTVFVVVTDPDLYKIRTMVHSSGMSSWREIAQNPAYPITGEGVFSHGRLHWLINFNTYCKPPDERKIVWFDLKKEEFGLAGPPTKEHDWLHLQLAELNGEVGFAYKGPSCLKLWTLKQEEWVLHCCFDLSVILPQHYRSDVYVSGCWNKDGDILLTSNRGKRLFLYTLKTGGLQEVDQHDPCEAAIILMYQSSLFLVTSASLFT